MKVICKGCGKKKRVNPSDIKDLDNYYCRRCMPKYRKQLREKGVRHECDWSTQHFLNRLAMENGHESIFLKHNTEVEHG